MSNRGLLRDTPSPVPLPLASPSSPPPFSAPLPLQNHPYTAAISTPPPSSAPPFARSHTQPIPAQSRLSSDIGPSSRPASRLHRARSKRDLSEVVASSPSAPIPQRTSSASHGHAQSPSTQVRRPRASFDQLSRPQEPVTPSINRASSSSARRRATPGQDAMPSYVEGDEWVIAAVRAIGHEKKEKDDSASAKWNFGVAVTRNSVRSDGRWCREVEYTVWRKWDDFVALRDAVVSQFPHTDTQLPKFSKAGIFSSKSSRSTQVSHQKELDAFLLALFRLSHAITDSGPVREIFSRDVPLAGSVPYIESFSLLGPVAHNPLSSTSASTERLQDLERVQNVGQVLQTLGGSNTSEVDHGTVRGLARKRSEPLLGQQGLGEPATIRLPTARRGTASDARDAVGLDSGLQRKPSSGAPDRLTASQAHRPALSLQRAMTVDGVRPEVEPSLKTPTTSVHPMQYGPPASADRIRPAGVPKPGLRSFRSMTDVRTAARPPPTVPPPPVPTSLPPRYQPLPEISAEPASRFFAPGQGDDAHPFALRPGRHAVLPAAAVVGGSPKRYRHRRNQGSSSSSSTGSGSFGSQYEAAIALGLNLHGHKRSTDSADSLIYSDSSVASPRIPPTPPSAALGSGELRGGKYFFDETLGQYVPNTTLPAAPFFPIPPVARLAPASEPAEVLAPTSVLMSPSRSADSAMPTSTVNKRHGFYTGMTRARSSSGASQRPRLETILASPLVDAGSFGADTVLASLTLGSPSASPPPSKAPVSAAATPRPPESITVKVLHSESTNVVIKVSRDISLSKLRTKIAHKFSEGAGISLSHDGEYEWMLEATGRSSNSESTVKLTDDTAWKAASEGLSRVVVRVV